MGVFTIPRPTPEQLLIRQEYQFGRGHFTVIARAGTGKTTVTFDGIEHCPELQYGWVLYVAFNKKIEMAAKAKNTRPDKSLIIPRLEIKTVHGTGLRFVRTRWRSCGISFDGERADALTSAVCGTRAPEDVQRLVTKLHTKAREINPWATEPGELVDLALQFECEPDEEYREAGFDLGYVEMRALEAMDMAARQEPEVIDGADMIFLPLRNGWLRPTWNAVLVDETQDLTHAMLSIAKGVVKREGRIGLIGDDRQAIYQFRGAGSGMMAQLQQELNCKTLHMTTTFRCGKKIVELASRIVPDFTAAESNQDGAVIEQDLPDMLKTVEPGDYILSRLNAPLMPIAMSLMKAGKRAKVNGTDIGESLIKLAKKLQRKSSPTADRQEMPEFIERIVYWRDTQVAKLKAAKRAQRHIDFVQDKAQMLIDLAEDLDSVDSLIARLETLFVDPGRGDAGVILCSSVHKVKGLETDRVFVLRDSLRSHNEEELNIQYVAYTRAKELLVLVSGGVK